MKTGMHYRGLRFYLSLLIWILLLPTGCKKDVLFVPAGVPNNFLSDRNYKSLIVEIQYMAGYQPTAQTIDNLNSFLQSRLNKPKGITFVYESIPALGNGVYSIDDVAGLEKNNRTQKAHEDVMTAYFLFLDGNYTGNTSAGQILGISYGATSMVIFEKTIQNYSGGFGQPARDVLESTVLEHEFGHLLGLVNNGSAMKVNHQDGANGRHCNNQNCLMYYSTETSNIVSNIIGGIPALDANCLADLKNNGGK